MEVRLLEKEFRREDRESSFRTPLLSRLRGRLRWLFAEAGVRGDRKAEYVRCICGDAVEADEATEAIDEFDGVLIVHVGLAVTDLAITGLGGVTQSRGGDQPENGSTGVAG